MVSSLLLVRLVCESSLIGSGPKWFQYRHRQHDLLQLRQVQRIAAVRWQNRLL